MRAIVKVTKVNQKVEPAISRVHVESQLADTNVEI
jgi:hypothetical protein